jgi:hypothetical protein
MYYTCRPCGDIILKKNRIFVIFSIFILIMLLLSKVSLIFADAEYTIESQPQWVDTISSEKTSPTSDQLESGVALSLLDFQTKVDKNTISYFYHFTKRLINHNGIKNSGSIEVDFHPSRHKVVLHYIKIHRGTQTFNQLRPENIKTLQRESQLESQIYTGEKSLHIILEDIRAGDIIDYAYSILKPYDSLSESLSYNIRLDGYMPVFQMRERLLVPKELEISIQNHLTNLKPQIRDSAHYNEYIWDIKNLPIANIEEDTPTWFDPRPWIEVREKKNWHEIVLENLEFYKTPQALSKELNQYIQDIKGSSKTPSEQFITVMRFIQDKIRYMSIKDQVDIFLPIDPSLVFQKRFGDCQDKTLLALTILRKLGIDADAVLVNTDKGKELTSYLPDSHIFDHVIIVASIDGKSYWVDPTQSFQRGDLENFTQPDYGYALILNSKTTALTKMPEYSLSTPSRKIHESFDLRQENKELALFTVQTTFKNHSADSWRRHVHTKTKNELQQSYLEYFETFYPQIKVRKQLEITDNEDLNQITITEEYEIQNPWIHEEADKRWAFTFHADELSEYTKNNGIPSRSMPLSVFFPLNISKKITLLLPEKDWNFSPDTVLVKDDAFTFKRKERYKKNVFSVSFDYKTLKDHVDPKNIKEHNENLKKANDTTGGTIYDFIENPTVEKDYINWSNVLLLALSMGFFVFIAFKLYYYPVKETVFAPEPQYNGLEGWLLIIQILVVGSLIRDIFSFCEDMPLILSTNNWALLSDPASADFNPFKSVCILIATLFDALNIVMRVLLSLLFFKKKRLYPSLFICVIWGSFLWNTTDTVLASTLINEATTVKAIAQLTRGFLFSMLWTLYILKSKRVRNTFINP